MTMSTLSENGSLSQEEEEANLRTMRTISSFEDVYRTYKPRNLSTNESQYNEPHTTHKFKKKCLTPARIFEMKISPFTSIKSQDADCSLRPSTLIGEQVRGEIRKINQQSVKSSGCKAKPKDLQDCRNSNQNSYRIASGQIINANGICNYCCPGTEYPNYCDFGANCSPVQFIGSCPANCTGYYDQSPQETCCKYSTYNQEPKSKQKCPQKIDLCVCSSRSNESMEEDSSCKCDKQAQSLNGSEGPSDCVCFYRKSNKLDPNDCESAATSCLCNCDKSSSEDRGLAMPDDINEMNCPKNPMCYGESIMDYSCAGGCLPSEQNDTSDCCSSRVTSPTISRCLPSFLMKGCCPPTTNCPPCCGSCCPPPNMNCCDYSANCVDVESFLRKFKQSTTCTPSCISQPSPPCLDMCRESCMGTGTGFLNLNRYYCADNNCNSHNACYCTGYINDVLQNHTVYSMDYQPFGCNGNNFNHFGNGCRGARLGCHGGCCFIRDGCRVAGAGGMSSSESHSSNPCYSACQTECCGGNSSSAGCGLCGDLCGGQSNGIYAIGDICCNMNTQNCYPLSQLSPGFCSAFPTGCCMPCSSTTCSSCSYPCNMGCSVLSTCGNGGMYGCCSKATSCNISQCSTE